MTEQSKTLPREPTEAMVAAGRRTAPSNAIVRCIYRAMFDAGPSSTPPVEGELARLADIVRGNMPAKLAEAIPVVDRALREALATRTDPEPHGGGHEPDYYVSATDPPAADELCDGCPPVGYPTDKMRCLPCPRRSPLSADKLAELRERLIIELAGAWRGAKKGFVPLAPDLLERLGRILFRHEKDMNYRAVIADLLHEADALAAERIKR